MDSVFLKGSLGERHKIFNAALKKVCNEKKSINDVRNFHPQDDINHLLKIDIANHFKDVNYILEVLKSDDNLLKNRAMKCVWLFDASAFPEISRVNYMADNLFPFVSHNTKCRIIHHLSIHLEDEKLSQEYFEYFKSVDDIQHAIKFLPLCSVSFVEGALDDERFVLTETLLLKIAEKDLNLVYKYFKLHTRRKLLAGQYNKVPGILINNDTERFLNWYEMDVYPINIRIALGARASGKLLKYHKERIVKSFLKYVNCLKRRVVVENLNLNEIKEVLIQLLPRKECDFWNESKLFVSFMKTFSKVQQFDVIIHIYKYVYGREFPKQKCLFDTKWSGVLNLNLTQELALMNIDDKVRYSGNKPLFCWYAFVDFELAYPRLKSLLATESKAKKRLEMLTVMIDSYCRHERSDDLLQMLTYYLNNHINEKDTDFFIYKLLTETVMYKCSDAAWIKLYEIFQKYNLCEFEAFSTISSMCTNEIIRRHLWKKTEVPDKFIDIYSKDPNCKIHKKDNSDISFENEFFNVVFNRMHHKFNETDNDEYQKMNLFDQMVYFMMEWNNTYKNHKKSLSAYPSIIEYMIINTPFLNYCYKHYIKTDRDLFRRFTDVLLMRDASERIILYCLKHNRHIFNNPDKIILKRICSWWFNPCKFYRKLRIYFSDDLAKFWTNYFFNMLNDPMCDAYSLRKAICALSVLLEKEEFEKILKPYTPTDAIIEWSKMDKGILERSKLTAKYCHYIRPVISPKLILSYAKGDYLQYVHGALHSVCFHYSLEQSKSLVLELINKPVSVQKHGIFLLLRLFDGPEACNLLMKIWSKNKNESIRYIIYKILVKFLANSLQEEKRERYFNFFKLVMKDLSGEKDDVIFTLVVNNLTNIHPAIFSEYCECCWTMLIKCNDRRNIIKLLQKISKKSILLNDAFLNNIVKYFMQVYLKNEIIFEHKEHSEFDTEMVSFIINYLLYPKDESQQSKRIHYGYNLLMQGLKEKWNTEEIHQETKWFYFSFVENIITESFSVETYKNTEKLLNYILLDISTFTSVSESLKTVILIRLAILHHKIFAPLQAMENELNIKAGPSHDNLLSKISESWIYFGKNSGELLIELINNNFLLINILFEHIFKMFICKLDTNCKYFRKCLSPTYAKLNIAKGFLSNTNGINSSLMGLRLLSAKIEEEDSSKKLYLQITDDLRNDKRSEVTLFLNNSVLSSQEE